MNSSGCSNDGLLDYFQEYWNTYRTDVHRDIAELFSGTGLECYDDGSCVIGCAYMETSCVYQSTYSYGINYVTYTTNTVSRSNLVSHEVGHTLGAYHDESSTEYIMYPYNSATDKSFGPTSIDSFLVSRNDDCITEYDGGDGDGDGENGDGDACTCSDMDNTDVESCVKHCDVGVCLWDFLYSNCITNPLLA